MAPSPSTKVVVSITPVTCGIAALKQNATVLKQPRGIGAKGHGIGLIFGNKPMISLACRGAYVNFGNQQQQKVSIVSQVPRNQPQLESGNGKNA